jgi:hypothetical protein
MSEIVLIDRLAAMAMFSGMLDGTSGNRLLRIIGAEKMGKSRLLREYRKMVQERWGGNCALIDLRSKFQTYSAIVFQVTQQTPNIRYAEFSEAQAQLFSAPKIELSDLNLFFSKLSVSLPDQSSDSAEEYARQRITSAFCEDLRSAQLDSPMVLLFDTFDGAAQNTQDWLSEQVLLPLLQIQNIYVVLAGRELPELPGLLASSSKTHTLPPVSLEDHIAYCTSLGINVSREVIEAFHRVFEGTPGLFSEYASKLIEY